MIMEEEEEEKYNLLGGQGAVDEFVEVKLFECPLEEDADADQDEQISLDQLQKQKHLEVQLLNQQKQIQLLSCVVEILADWMSINLDIQLFSDKTHKNDLKKWLQGIDQSQIDRISAVLSSLSSSVSFTRTTIHHTTIVQDTKHEKKKKLIKTKIIKGKQLRQTTPKNNTTQQQQHQAKNGSRIEFKTGYNDDDDDEQQHSQMLEMDEDFSLHDDDHDFGNAANAAAQPSSSSGGGGRPRRSCTISKKSKIATNANDDDEGVGVGAGDEDYNPIPIQDSDEDDQDFEKRKRPKKKLKAGLPDKKKITKAQLDAMDDATRELVTRSDQIPSIIQQRETYYKIKLKELFEECFEPIYKKKQENGQGSALAQLQDQEKAKKKEKKPRRGVVISQKCKLCPAVFHNTPKNEQLVHHLSVHHSEVTRTKYKLEYKAKFCKNGEVDDDGELAKSANVWSLFTTVRLDHKTQHSFCKACGTKINSPKAHRLIHHLEICGALREEEEEPDPDEMELTLANAVPQYKKEKEKVPKVPKAKQRLICEVCGKVIKRGPDRLAIHMVTHSKKRPFKCDQCPYAAKLKYALKKHILVIHQGVKLVRKNPPIRRGGKRPEPIIIDEDDDDVDEQGAGVGAVESEPVEIPDLGLVVQQYYTSSINHYNYVVGDGGM